MPCAPPIVRSRASPDLFAYPPPAARAHERPEGARPMSSPSRIDGNVLSSLCHHTMSKLLTSPGLVTPLQTPTDIDATTPPATCADAASAPPLRLPEVTLEGVDPLDSKLIRRSVLKSKQDLVTQRGWFFGETRGLKPSPEKSHLYQCIRSCVDRENELEAHLTTRFMPCHGPEQLLSPRVFFESALFRVRRSSDTRISQLTFDFPSVIGRPRIRYKGPELGQSDGRVFLALLNIMRDVQVGTAATVHPGALCQALYGRYDGPARKMLFETICRLQQALILFDTFSVQLCGRFDYPKKGPWTVGLDRQLTELFLASKEVWLRLQPRLSLPEGLATWLYSYIESQTRLIPMPLPTLQALCGSKASPKAFVNRMRDALGHLSTADVIDPGWSLKNGQVRWMKARRRDQ